MAFVDADIPFPGNKKPGMSDEILFIKKGDLDTIGGITDTSTNVGQVTITTAHVPATGKGFQKLEAFNATVVLSDESQGEVGSTSQPATVELQLPETAAMKVLLESGEPYIVLAKSGDCADGVYRQLGDACIPAFFKGSFGSGTTGGSDRRGYSGTIEAKGGWKYYDAAVTLLNP